jgi:4'-phosphopantetheinyl transferase superfamily
LRSPGGLGIDLAEPSAFEHPDPTAIGRAASRWLSPAELAWCCRQPCFRQALVTVLSCKESVCKATGGSVPVHEVTVAMGGGWPRGWAWSTVPGSDPVTLWWEAGSGHILTVGIAGPAGPARRLLNRLIRVRRGAETF